MCGAFAPVGDATVTAQRRGIRLGKAGSGPEIDEAGPHSVGAQWLPAETIEGCSGRMAGASMQYIFKTDIETLWKVLEWMKRRGAGPHGGYVTVGLYGMVECEDIFDAIAGFLRKSLDSIPKARDGASHHIYCALQYGVP